MRTGFRRHYGRITIHSMISGMSGGSFHQVVSRAQSLSQARILSLESHLDGVTFSLYFDCEGGLGTFEACAVRSL